MLFVVVLPIGAVVGFLALYDPWKRTTENAPRPKIFQQKR